MTRPGPGAVQVEGSLARLLRPDVTEEIRTSAGGIRQDFVVLQRPAGQGALQVKQGS